LLSLKWSHVDQVYACLRLPTSKTGAELTGGNVMRGIHLLEYAAYDDYPGAYEPGAHEAEQACVRAIKEWRDLTRDLMGWALAATIGASAKGWHAPNDNLAPRYRLIAYLREATDRAAAGDTYVIAALSKEMTRKTILALQKLEYGEVDSILEPTKRKSYKDGWTIRRLQERIVFAYHYCYGSGLSKLDARKRVAGFVREDADNLRNWERKFEAEADILDEIYEEYALDYEERRIKYQIAGAVAKGVAVEDARKHLGISELGQPRKPGLWPSKHGYATDWWNFCLRRPLRWDDKYLEKLGRDYQAALKEQKRAVQRRRR
jgi:hypothetical protein